MAKTTKTRVRVAGTNPGKAPPKSTTTKNAKAKNAKTTSGWETDPGIVAESAGKPRGTASPEAGKPGGTASPEAPSGEKTFTFDWGKASKKVKGQLRQLVRDGDNEGYAKLAAEKLGMSAEEAAHWFQNEANRVANRKATTRSSGPASESAPETGSPEAPRKSSVTAGAREKSGGFGSIISGWDDATKRDYSDLVSRANKGDKTARGILFNGTKNGGKNKFGLTRAQVVTGLSDAERTGRAIKGYAPSATSSKSGSNASSVDIDAPMEDTGTTAYKSLSRLAAERAGGPRGGTIGWDSFTPGGWVAAARKATRPTSRRAVESTILNTNAGIAALAAADAIGRSVQNAAGTELKDQDWSAAEYLNPLLGVASLAESAARKFGSGSVAVPGDLLTDRFRRDEAARKEFDALIARASRTVDSNGNPVSGADFRTAFNHVRARYADAVSAAGRLGGEELRTAAMDRARSQANASLAALSANRRFMDASYAQGDLAAVNKALRTAGYQDEIDDLGAAEDFIVNAEVDDATRAKFMDTYKKTMSDRSAMSPVDRLGW